MVVKAVALACFFLHKAGPKVLFVKPYGRYLLNSADTMLVPGPPIEIRFICKHLFGLCVGIELYDKFFRGAAVVMCPRKNAR